MYDQVMSSFTHNSPVETCLGYLPKIHLDLLYGKDLKERDATHKFIQRVIQVFNEKIEEDVILDQRLSTSCNNDIIYL